MTKNPAFYLILMTCWIVPFFFVYLFSYPVWNYFSSYLPFFISFIVVAVYAYFLSFLNLKFSFWERYGHWKRFFVLIAAYAVTIISILTIIVILDDKGLIKYFGGDAGGSFGLLFVPSIIFYFIFGILFSTIITVMRKKNLSL